MRRQAPVVILATLLLGCHGGSAESAAGRRWIEGAPADELKVSQLSRVDCALAANFDAGWPLPELSLVAGALIGTAGEHGLTVRGGETGPRLRIARTFAPGEIDAVRLGVAGLRRGSVRLHWSVAADSGLSGSLELTSAQGGGTLHDQFFFDLAGRLPASDPVALDLEPTSLGGEVVTVSDLCVGIQHPDADRLLLAARVPWKATLADEVRDVLVVPPAGSIERDLDLPRSARLTTGFGRLAGTAGGVRITVEEAGDVAPQPLLDRRLSREELAAGWVDLDVDLAALGAGRRRLRLRAASDPAGDPAFVGAWSAPRIVSPAVRSDRPNIVLISLDTLRADHLSLYGYSKATSPNIDAWARQRRAAVFRQVVPASGWTLPSHFSLFTGLEAFKHPANYNMVAVDSSEFHFLAERLLAAGYRTQAYTGGGFVHPSYGFAKGFEGFAYWAAKDRLAEELGSNLERATRWLDRQAAPRGAGADAGDPFLLFLHTYEIHTPNAARQPYFSKLSRLPADLIVDFEADGEPRKSGFLGTSHAVIRKAAGAPGEPLPVALAGLPSDLYDSAIAYVDDLLGPFLRRLSEPPFDRDTIVVITSDHGESLGEGGRFSHASLALETLLVPLVMVLPGETSARDVPSQVRLIDLYPTLLELAGVEVPTTIDGRTLRPLLAGETEPEGRTAWAYAASTNQGLSLLAPGGLKLDWRNSVWNPIAGQLRWFRHRGFEETPLAEAPATGDADSMLRQMQQVYSREVQGLRFDLRNRSRQSVDVSITSDLVDPVSVKSPLVAGARLEWMRVGEMAAPLAAGESLVLQFERSPRREIELQIAVSSGTCPAARVTTSIVAAVDQLRQPLRRQLELPACPNGAGGPRGGAGPGRLDLEVVWKGALPATSTAGPDAALREDLKALGYLH